MELGDFLKKYGDAKLGRLWADELGVYVISPRCPAGFSKQPELCDEYPRKVKIGVAHGSHGFRKRFETYKTYWPQGLRIWHLIRTDSMDPTAVFYKDLASQRETALKQLLKSKRGFQDTSGAPGQSEWVRLKPGEILPYLLHVAEARDEVYSCTDACRVVKPWGAPGTPLKLTRATAKTESNRRRDARRTTRQAGRERPRVTTRGMTEIARNTGLAGHDLALAQARALDEEYQQTMGTLKLQTDSKERRRQERILEKDYRTRAQHAKAAIAKARRAREPRAIRELQTSKHFLGPAGAVPGAPTRPPRGGGTAPVGALARKLKDQGRLHRGIYNNMKQQAAAQGGYRYREPDGNQSEVARTAKARTAKAAKAAKARTAKAATAKAAKAAKARATERRDRQAAAQGLLQMSVQ